MASGNPLIKKIVNQIFQKIYLSEYKYGIGVHSKKTSILLHKIEGPIAFGLSLMISAFVVYRLASKTLKMERISAVMNEMCPSRCRQCNSYEANYFTMGIGSNVRPAIIGAITLSCSNVSVLEKVIRAGASLESRDPSGKTLLEIALDKRSSEMVKCLIEAGISLEDVDKEGRTPLLLAAIAGKWEIVKIFIEAGANINYTDREEKTVLHYVAKIRYSRYESGDSMVTALLDAGASLPKKVFWQEYPDDVVQEFTKRGSIPLVAEEFFCDQDRELLSREGSRRNVPQNPAEAEIMSKIILDYFH